MNLSDRFFICPPTIWCVGLASKAQASHWHARNLVDLLLLRSIIRSHCLSPVVWPFRFSAIHLGQNKHTRQGRCWREVEGLRSVWDQSRDATGAQIGARSSPSATLQHIMNWSVFTASSWTRNTRKVFWAGSCCANLWWSLRRQDRTLTRKSWIHGEMSGDITWEFHRVLVFIKHWDSAALSSYLDSKLRDDNQCRFYLIIAWGCEQSGILN